jgi:hypothetical protein
VHIVCLGKGVADVLGIRRSESLQTVTQLAAGTVKP